MQISLVNYKFIFDQVSSQTSFLRIQIFLNPQLFSPDTASVHNYPTNKAANLILDIFESDDVATSCPCSLLPNNKPIWPHNVQEQFLQSESEYHWMLVDRRIQYEISFDRESCRFKNILICVDRALANDAVAIFKVLIVVQPVPQQRKLHCPLFGVLLKKYTQQAPQFLT